MPIEVALVRAWPHEIVGELFDADLLVIGGPRAREPGGGSVSSPARPFGTPRAPCCWRHGPRSGCRHQDSS